MQHVGDQGNLVKNGNDQPAGGLSPAKAFFALLALLVAIGGLFLLTRPGDDPNPGPAPKSDNFALTDAEAIDRFRELDALRITALRSRDASLISHVFTPKSPAADDVAASIRTLTRQSVLFRSTYESKSVRVTENTPTEIHVLQRVVVTPSFVSEEGEDVTRDDSSQLQETDWTLRRVADLWLIHDGVITNVTNVKS
jgi:hypothetical protein